MCQRSSKEKLKELTIYEEISNVSYELPLDYDIDYEVNTTPNFDIDYEVNTKPF